MKVSLNNKTAISLVVIAALIGVAGYLLAQVYLPKAGYATYLGSGNGEVNPLNIFMGKITNAKVSPGQIEGFTTYDSNCVQDGAMIQCDSGLRTSEYGVLNFHYKHADMAIQPCLHMFGSEKVILEILDSDGNAKVTRTIDTSSMAGHHG